jgi:hypothetical protein
LASVGAKFVAQGFGLRIPIFASLLVIATTITVVIVVSLTATRDKKPGQGRPGPAGERGRRT